MRRNLPCEDLSTDTRQNSKGKGHKAGMSLVCFRTRENNKGKGHTAGTNLVFSKAREKSCVAEA